MVAPSISSSREWPRRAWVSRMVRTSTPGAKRAASWAQFSTTLVGATTRNRASGVVLEHVQAQGEGLDGLPEPHVVGEDPAEAVAVQERQPVEPLLLVVAQRGVEAGRDRHRLGGGERRHAPDAVGPAL